MTKNKLDTREELTRHYLDEALKGSTTFNIEKIIREVELVVDAIMRAREVDFNDQFYLVMEKELDNGKD